MPGLVEFMCGELEIEDEWVRGKLERMREERVGEGERKGKRKHAEFTLFKEEEVKPINSDGRRKAIRPHKLSSAQK